MRLNYANNSANGPLGSAIRAATEPSSTFFKPGKTRLFKPIVTLATSFADTLYEYPRLAKIAFVVSARFLTSAVNYPN